MYCESTLTLLRSIKFECRIHILGCEITCLIKKEVLNPLKANFQIIFFKFLNTWCCMSFQESCFPPRGIFGYEKILLVLYTFTWNGSRFLAQVHHQTGKKSSNNQL